MRQHSAIFPGTFDPITNGHLDLIERASNLFDNVIVAIAHNPGKQPRFDLSTRLDLASKTLKHLPNVTVETFSTLLVEFAKSRGVRLIIRGLRAVSDFEFELQLAKMNRELNTDIETLFIPSGEQYGFISSSLISEIAQLQGDVSAFVPSPVAIALKEKFQKR